MEKSEYLRRSNWYGSFYELAMEFHPRGSDARLLAALQGLWADPCLYGPLRSPYSYEEEELTLLSPPTPHEPAQQAVPFVPLPDALDSVDPGDLYGLLLLPGQLTIGIKCIIVREDHGSDWLDLCIPTGMLERIVDVDYPLLHETNPWLAGVDQVLLRLADAVYAASPFDLALIGEAASGYLRAEEAGAADLETGGILAPHDLVRRLQPRRASAILPSGLHWFPAERDGGA